jgi:hypothetical protein
VAGRSIDAAAPRTAWAPPATIAPTRGAANAFGIEAADGLAWLAEICMSLSCGPVSP